MACSRSSAPGTRAAACSVGRWSGPLVTVLAVAVPVLWYLRERETSALRAEVAELRAYAGEIEQGLAVVGGQERRPRRRRRHLASVAGGTVAAAVAFALILPSVAQVLG